MKFIKWCKVDDANTVNVDEGDTVTVTMKWKFLTNGSVKQRGFSLEKMLEKNK